MSTISEKLKISKEPYFLVELDFNGLVKKYSTKTISVPYFAGDAKLFDGKILSMDYPGTSFDMSSFTYSVSSIQIELANDIDFHNEESRNILDGGSGKIYVWCPGLDWADIDDEGLIFQGVFHKNYHTKLKYSFTLADYIYTKTKTIPDVTINTDTWVNHRTEGGGGSAAGDAQPLLFGNWSKSVPLLCVVDNTTWTYLVSKGVVLAEATNFADDAGSTSLFDVYDKDGTVIKSTRYSFTKNGVDGKGNISSYFEFNTTDPTDEEPLSCSLKGIRDGSGDYTGTANTLMEHPSDITYFILNNFTNLNFIDVNVQSIKAMKVLLPGYKFASIINKQENSIDIIDRILRQCFSARLQVAGKVGLVTFSKTPITTVRINDKYDCIKDTIIFSKTPSDLIYNNIESFYKLNPTESAWEGQLTRNRSNNRTCKLSYQKYGEQPMKVLKFPDIHLKEIAEAIVNKYIDFFAFRHDLIEMEVPYHVGFDVREGDGGLLTMEDGPSVDNSGWDKEPCLLLEKRFKPNTIYLKWWRIAEI